MTTKRILALREKMTELSLDATLITSFENYRYFSGFSGSNCVLIITQDKLFALTDGRYDVQIRLQTSGFDITVITNPMNTHITEILSSLPLTRIGFEAQNMTALSFEKIKGALGDKISFVPVDSSLEEIRAVKDADEIECIRRAAKIADDAFSAMLQKLKKGTTEKQCAALLEYEMAMHGSEKAAFSTIAASSVRGAMPHASAEAIEIPDNCLMTFDFGAVSGGYCSDITRTIHIGNPSDELCRIWDIVFEVQQKCLSEVRAGISCRELDELARELFAEHDMEKYFTHSLGHGVGLAIHEAPTLSKRSETVLSENMIVTIEPGLYIEGLGGVRIEDSVVVTRDGCEILTHSPYKININL